MLTSLYITPNLVVSSTMDMVSPSISIWICPSKQHKTTLHYNNNFARFLLFLSSTAPCHRCALRCRTVVWALRGVVTKKPNAFERRINVHDKTRSRLFPNGVHPRGRPASRASTLSEGALALLLLHLFHSAADRSKARSGGLLFPLSFAHMAGCYRRNEM